MLHRVRISALLALSLLVAAASTAAATALQLTQADWTTHGSMVQFHLQFMNPNPVMQSDPTDVHIMSQEYGAFLPIYGPIGDATVPPLQPNSFFDVFVEVPLTQLPPKPEEIFDAPGRGPVVNAVPCDPGDHWDGNIDVTWMSATCGGHTNYHVGDQKVCPGGGNSYIHVRGFFCSTPVAWVIGTVCPGWSAAVVNEDFTPAPNPVPPGWTGWLCMKADATVTSGSTCCVRFTFLCDGVAANVDLCAQACDCITPVEPMTWGKIKSLYR